MKYLLRFIMVISLVLGISSTASATTLLTGTLKNPDTTGFTGTLLMSLSQQASISAAGACGGPLLAVPVIPVTVKFNNGAISNGPISVYGSDCTLPYGIPYNVKGIDANGNTVFTDQWLITGTTQDLGNITSVATGQTGTIGVTGPIISNPTGNQVINQPTGTALTINNLTVTGTFVIPEGTTISANSANKATQFAATPTNCTNVGGSTGFNPNNGFVGYAAGVDVFGNALCVQPNFMQLNGQLQSTQLTLDTLTAAIGYQPLNPVVVGVASGVASLDTNGTVPLSQLPIIPLTQIGDGSGNGIDTSGFCVLSGCTMSGEITLPDDTQTGSQAVTANYVLNQIGPLTVTAANAYSLALKAVQTISVGAPNGVASLDLNSLVYTTNLPYASATQDGIITAAQFTAFATGGSGGGGGGGGGGGTISLPANAIPYQGISGTSPVAATYANIASLYHSIVYSGGTPSNVACSGVLQANGVCGTLASLSGVAVDSNGNLTTFADAQFNTNANGITSLACSEDHDKGVFDPRCNRVETIDGNSTIVNIYTHSALAAQQTLNDANCWTKKNGRSATTNFPPGFFKVGLATEPTLTAGPGQIVDGVGTFGLGPVGSGGTVFGASYNNDYVYAQQASYSSLCSDGTTVTNDLDGGSTRNIMVTGCSEGGCTNKPSDTNTYAGGGPNNGGIYIGLGHGVSKGLRSAYTGGPGITNAGLDSEFNDEWAYDALTWWRFDRGNINGVAYNPSTDGYHGGIENLTLDGRFDHQEIYGTFNTPYSEFGHVCGLVIGGGHSITEDVFQQIDEFGICAPFGVQVRVTDFRAEGNSGPNIENNTASTWMNGLSNGGCMSAAGVVLLGNHCSDLTDNSGGTGMYIGVSVNDEGGIFGGASSRTSYILPHGATFIGVSNANGHGFESNYNYYSAANFGVGVQMPEMEHTQPDGGTPLAGVYPDVGENLHHIRMSNASPTNIIGLSHALTGQTLYVTLSSANDVLVSSANGGWWYTCSGQNIVGPGGTYTFDVFAAQALSSVKYQERCPSLPLNLTGNTIQSSTFQAVTMASSQYNLQMFSGGASTAQYCYAAAAWIGTAYISSGSMCENHTPPSVTTSMDSVSWHWTVPPGTNEIDVYRISTTDSTFSTTYHMGRIYRQQFSTPLQIPSTFIGVDTAVVSLDSSTTPLNVNTTGNMFAARTPPATDTEPCTAGETAYGTVSSNFGLFYCNASDRATNTYHWNFYTLTPGSF